MEKVHGGGRLEPRKGSRGGNSMEEKVLSFIHTDTFIVISPGFINYEIPIKHIWAIA